MPKSPIASWRSARRRPSPRATRHRTPGGPPRCRRASRGRRCQSREAQEGPRRGWRLEGARGSGAAPRTGGAPRRPRAAEAPRWVARIEAARREANARRRPNARRAPRWPARPRAHEREAQQRAEATGCRKRPQPAAGGGAPRRGRRAGAERRGERGGRKRATRERKSATPAVERLPPSAAPSGRTRRRAALARRPWPRTPPRPGGFAAAAAVAAPRSASRRRGARGLGRHAARANGAVL